MTDVPMTTLNRDEIAALRPDFDPMASQIGSLIRQSDLAALCDMATRLLDLCEARPTIFVDAAGNVAVTDDGAEAFKAAWDAVPENTFGPVVLKKLMPLYIIPRPESKP